MMGSIDEVLKNLFDPDKTVTQFAEIDSQVVPGRYKLIDDADREIYATSTEFWPKGVRVMVRAGEIVGRANLAGEHKIFEV